MKERNRASLISCKPNCRDSKMSVREELGQWLMECEEQLREAKRGLFRIRKFNARQAVDLYPPYSLILYPFQKIHLPVRLPKRTHKDYVMEVRSRPFNLMNNSLYVVRQIVEEGMDNVVIVHIRNLGEQEIILSEDDPFARLLFTEKATFETESLYYDNHLDEVSSSSEAVEKEEEIEMYSNILKNLREELASKFGAGKSACEENPVAGSAEGSSQPSRSTLLRGESATEGIAIGQADSMGRSTEGGCASYLRDVSEE